MYSFVHPGLSLGERARLRLESLSGQVIYSVTKPNQNVRVLLAVVPACHVAETGTELERKRAAYWHNPVRNDTIAAIARAVAEGQVEELDDVVHDHDDDLDDVVLDHADELAAAHSVTGEHVEELAAVAGGHSTELGITGGDVAGQAAVARGKVDELGGAGDGVAELGDVAVGRIAELRKLLPGCTPDDARLLRNARQLVILVESPEHGRELLTRRPSWTLVDAVPGTELANHDMAAVKPAKLITTLVRAQRSGMAADVLIRAAGDRWPLHANGLLADLHNENKIVMLIDFADEFDAAARSATAERLRDYRSQSWDVAHVPA